MDAQQNLTKGLGNLDADLRRQVYRDLREGLGISDAEPMLPLPAPELAAWSRRCAEMLVAALEQRAATRPVASVPLIEASILDYAKPADDAFLDSQVAAGAAFRDAGLPGVYLHAFVNKLALEIAPRAAREVLPAASVALVEERYPAVVLLRHALFQEGYLGVSRIGG